MFKNSQVKHTRLRIALSNSSRGPFLGIHLWVTLHLNPTLTSSDFFPNTPKKCQKLRGSQTFIENSQYSITQFYIRQKGLTWGLIPFQLSYREAPAAVHEMGYKPCGLTRNKAVSPLGRCPCIFSFKSFKLSLFLFLHH